jgi:uncharacterized protein
MWLLRDGDVLASVEVARRMGPRMRGLLGRDGLDGALLLQPAMHVHTFGMRFPLDVAYLDGDLTVVAITRMRPWRVGVPRVRSRAVLEAEAGSFERWHLAIGDALELS